MVIYIGADHRGFALKHSLIELLKFNGYPVVDVGAEALVTDDDYVDYAMPVAERVSIDYEHNRGILICGSGVGMCVVANKYMNVRASLVSTSDQAFDSRSDDNANVLCLGANYMNVEQAKKVVLTWLQTPFSEDVRHKRRLEKIAQLEMKITKPLNDEM